MENILENFTSNIPEETKTILRNKFGWIQNEDEKYFLNSVVEEDDEHYPKTYYSTEQRVLNVLLMMI